MFIVLVLYVGAGYVGREVEFALVQRACHRTSVRGHTASVCVHHHTGIFKVGPGYYVYDAVCGKFAETLAVAAQTYFYALYHVERHGNVVKSIYAAEHTIYPLPVHKYGHRITFAASDIDLSEGTHRAVPAYRNARNAGQNAFERLNRT